MYEHCQHDKNEMIKKSYNKTRIFRVLNILIKNMTNKLYICSLHKKCLPLDVLKFRIVDS